MSVIGKLNDTGTITGSISDNTEELNSLPTSSEGELVGELNNASGLSASLSGATKLGGSMSRSDAGNYEELRNLPKINAVELKGNRSFDDLGMVEATNLEIDALFKQYF